MCNRVAYCEKAAQTFEIRADEAGRECAGKCPDLVTRLLSRQNFVSFRLVNALKRLISCSGAASAFVSAVISLSMPNADVAPAAQPGADQPKVVRDGSAGLAFQEALGGELSSGAEDSQQTSANDSDTPS